MCEGITTTEFGEQYVVLYGRRKTALEHWAVIWIAHLICEEYDENIATKVLAGFRSVCSRNISTTLFKGIGAVDDSTDICVSKIKNPKTGFS